MNGPRQWANPELFEAVRPSFQDLVSKPMDGSKSSYEGVKRGCAKVSTGDCFAPLAMTKSRCYCHCERSERSEGTAEAISFIKRKGSSMKANWKIDVWKIIALALLLLSSACSRNSTQPAVEEHDGAELVSLMGRAQEALENEDAEGFQSLFPENSLGTAKSVWNRLLREKESSDAYKIMQVMSYPELERATTGVHVNRLVLGAWYEFSSGYEERSNVYHTTWIFTREQLNSQWKLQDLKINRSNVGYRSPYDALTSDLNQMDRASFLSLEMEWEDSANPSPLLVKTLQALADEDLEKLKAYTVDGTLFYALSMGVEMTSVASDSSASGKYNRDQSVASLKEQIKNIKRASNTLKVAPNDLAPYFTAYSVISMPEHCAKLDLSIEFDGSGLSKNVKSFTVSWSAVCLKDVWLIDSMYISSTKVYEQ